MGRLVIQNEGLALGIMGDAFVGTRLNAHVVWISVAAGMHLAYKGNVATLIRQLIHRK